jgi:hypothetical protein
MIMEAILQSLLDVSGVTAALVFDGSGHLVGHRGQAIYDRALCEEVSGALARALDAVRLQHEGWESLVAHYADGKLVLRRIGAAEEPHVLALVATAALNPSFATVAIRVAAGKLRRLLEGGASSAAAASGAASSSTASSSVAPAPSASAAATPESSRPVLASSGLSWSKVSSVGLSRVAVADPASGAFLSRCAKELAQHVGPMAKVYVEEAVRRVSPDAPFALGQRAALVEDLAGQVEDADDRAAFLKAMAKG